MPAVHNIINRSQLLENENVNLYPSIIYKLIDGVTNKWLFNHNTFEDANVIAQEHCSLAQTLAKLEYHRLIDNIISSTSDYSFFSDSLIAYLRLNQSDRVCALLDKYPELIAIDQLKVMNEFLEARMEAATISYAKYLYQQTQGDHSLSSLLERIYELKDFNLAEKIIQEVLEPEKQALEILNKKVFQKMDISLEEIEIAMNKIFSLFSDLDPESDYYSVTHVVCKKANDFFSNLSINEVNLIFIKDAFIRASEILRLSKFPNESLELTWKLQAEIRKELYDAREFEKAKEFIVICNNEKYFAQEVAEAKIKFAKESNDGLLHKEALLDFVNSINNSKFYYDQNTNFIEIEDPEKLPRFPRIEYYTRLAKKHAEYALYELRYGDNKIAHEHIERMIENIEATGKAPKECPDAHRIVLRHKKRTLKKEFKRQFLAEGFFEHLPKKIGWNTPVKSLMEVKSDREKYLSIKGQRKDYEADAELRDTHSQNLKFELLNAKIEAGEIAEAIKLFSNFTILGVDSCDWKIACLIIEAQPSAFLTLYTVLSEEYFRKDLRYSYDLSWGGFAKFYALAFSLGQIKDTEWSYFYNNAFKRDSSGPKISNQLVVNMIKEFLAYGHVTQAWDIYNKVIRYRGAISCATHQLCFAYFINSITETKAWHSGISMALIGNRPNEQSDKMIDVAYWNTESELHQMTVKTLKTNYEDEAFDNEEMKACKNAFKESEKYLLDACSTLGTVRIFTKLLKVGTGRNPHQLKDALLSIHDRSPIGENTRLRTVDALISHKIPGSEGLDDINRKSTPLEYSKYYFRKLVQNETLHKNTLFYINQDRQLIYLKRLISEFQNQFNNVMESLDHPSLTGGQPAQLANLASYSIVDDNKLKDLSDKDWSNIFCTLRTLGTFTPGIFAEARAVNFDPVQMQQIKTKLDKLKEGLFSSKPLNTTLTKELTAEVIYAAYKPANMPFSALQNILVSLVDCSHHLDRFTFPENGYVLNLRNRSSMRLRTKDTELKALATLTQIADKTELCRENKEVIQSSTSTEKYASLVQEKTKLFCSIGKFGSLDEISIVDILSIFYSEKFVVNCIRDAISPHSDDSRYNTLRHFQEILGIYLKDNLEKVLKQYFNMNSEHTSKMINSLADNLRKDKLQDAYLKQCRMNLDPTLDNLSLTAKAISAVILLKVKTLKTIRKNVEDDLRKFVTVNNQICSSNLPRLRAVISKNIAAFFGKASAGICTDYDIMLFMREDHFDINIIDDDQQVCVGNVQAYIMNYQGRAHLLLRGFNPSTNLLKEIDAQSFCDAIIEIAELFARENKLGGIIISEAGDFLALSNRPDVASYLLSKYIDCRIKFDPFRIASSSNAIISGGYLIASFENVVVKNFEFKQNLELDVGEYCHSN